MSAHPFSNLAGVKAALRRAASHLVPPPDMLPSEWAEKNIKIPAGNAIPGPINFDNAPYQRGMLDVVKEPGVYRVDYMTGAQLGKTTVQQCVIGYFIGHEPKSQIFAQPSQGDMQTFLETKLQPMLDANPVITKRMAKARGRDGANNQRLKSYIGGWLFMSWAGSAKTARSRSAPVVQADEVDGMPPTAEGDFLELLEQRNATFGDDRLFTRSSTPTFKGASRIESGFLGGDQRRYFVPCPDCGEQQYLKWEQISWPGRVSTSWEDTENDLHDQHEPQSAVYVCEHCGSCWDDGTRIAAIRTAEANGGGWIATATPKTVGHASFHAPEFLSTFRRLRDIVTSYLNKIRIGDLQAFMNVSAAETYEEPGEKADADSLLARAQASPYASGIVPAGGLVLTAGVDMQADRLEVEVVAWGHGEQSWQVDYVVLWGDPDAGDVWEELDELLGSAWQHESGARMPIMSTAVDTGGTGGNTQSAYEWLRGKTGRRIFAVKGQAPSFGKPIAQAPSRKQSGKTKRKVDLFMVAADEAKLTVTRRLAIDKPGPGYCHFPNDREKDYFQQLTAEKLVTRYVKGAPVKEWHQIRKRNEALDCRVYALAALKIANPSMRRQEERLNAANDNGGTVPTGRRLNARKPVNDNKPAAEIPQEEPQAEAAQGGEVKKRKRVLKSSRVKGSNFATNY